MLRVVLPLSVLFSLCAGACKDGVDNVVVMTDIFKGKRNVAFENFVLLTYDSRKQPSCGGREGKVAYPGYIRFQSGRLKIREPITVTGAAHLGFSLTKNSMFVGEVCRKGKSVNAYVNDDVCKIDLFQIAPINIMKELMKGGEFDINDFPGDWNDFKPLPPQDNPYIEGEWEVSVQLTMGGETLGGVKIGKSKYIEVTTTEAKEEL